MLCRRSSSLDQIPTCALHICCIVTGKILLLSPQDSWVIRTVLTAAAICSVSLFLAAVDSLLEGWPSRPQYPVQCLWCALHEGGKAQVNLLCFSLMIHPRVDAQHRIVPKLFVMKLAMHNAQVTRCQPGTAQIPRPPSRRRAPIARGSGRP